METYDIVICGAGPSGSTAAKFMAEKGLKVALLEKSSFPRDKACGGALRPSVVDDFPHIKNGLVRIPHTVCTRVKLFSPSLDNYIDYNADRPVMYNVQRKHFDAMLVEMAVDSGAELKENTEVKDVSLSPDGRVVRLKSGKELCGKVLIGAGGMHDPVARYLRRREGLPELWPKSDIAIAVMEEFELGERFILDNYGDEYTSYFHLRPQNLYGYAWTFAKEDTLNIGFGAFWKDIKSVNIKDTFNDYLSLLKKQGLIPEFLTSERIKGAQIPMRGSMPKPFSDRILLLGDAAGFVSPIGGDGIYYGMSSGRVAANIVEYAVNHDAYGQDTLGVYHRECQRLWGKDLETLCYFADKFFNKTDQVVRYASKDFILREQCVGLYTGDVKASVMKRRILWRIFRDYILYDIFKRE